MKSKLHFQQSLVILGEFSEEINVNHCEKECELDVQTKVRQLLTLKAPNKNCSRRHFKFLLLYFEKNKA